MILSGSVVLFRNSFRCWLLKRCGGTPGSRETLSGASCRTGDLANPRPCTTRPAIHLSTNYAPLSEDWSAVSTHTTFQYVMLQNSEQWCYPPSSPLKPLNRHAAASPNRPLPPPPRPLPLSSRPCVVTPSEPARDLDTANLSLMRKQTGNEKGRS